MDEPPPVPGSAPAPSPEPTMSLMARLFNLFATPGEVFDQVRTARPSAANWLVPASLCAVLGVLASFLIFSQPAIIQQIHEQQAKVFDAQVKAGKMTQAQADQAVAAAEKFSGPSVMKFFGSIGAVVGSFASVFWWAFLLWLIGRFALKADLGFMKMMEVAGLAAAISALEALVKTLLIFGLSNPLASPSLALLIKNPEPQNKLFMLLSMANIMTFWVLAVRAIGLGKVAGVPFGRAAAWVFGTWAVLSGVFFGIGAALQAIFVR
jgi:hypothetical protein